MLELLRNNQKLAEIMANICDVDIFPQLRQPDNEEGRLTFSLSGQAFARDGSGSEYIVFDDGSVGIRGSEGQYGRIADSLRDFFIFMANCPFWCDYIRTDVYNDMEALRELAAEAFEEHCAIAREEVDIDLRAVRKELAQGLGITLSEDVAQDVLMKFYESATREPRLYAEFRENDGNVTRSSGSLFN